MKRFLNYAFLFLIFLSFNGCFYNSSPTMSQILLEKLNSGKSIVIIPKISNTDTKMIWNIKDKNLTDSYFDGEFSFQDDYDIVILDAGTYYLSHFIEKIDDTYRLPQNNESFNASILNDAILYKMPEKKDIPNYYEIMYLLHDDLASIVINPSEVVLIPAISAHTRIRKNSCTPINMRKDNFFIRMLYSEHSHLLTSFLDALFADNGRHTWSWSCKTDLLFFYIKTIPIEDFLTFSFTSDLPIKNEQDIKTRGFDEGKLFQKAQEIETFNDYMRSYIIKEKR
ncbi:MAG: hypothetical protein LBS26_04095 [Campylobacteraceae bacterium]|jgi:hypothetical protein|nr:hypothetical protein [Campylobacteraceae bacterium]